MIIRIKKDKRFTVISRDSLQDKRLTWKATGLLAFLLSLPDDWTVNIRHLTSAKKDGRDGTVTGIRELENAGYIKKELVQDDGGKFVGYDYTVYEISQTTLPFTENPETVNPSPENPSPENPVLLNTNSTEQISTKIPLTQFVQKLKTKIPSVKNGYPLIQKYLKNAWRDGAERYPDTRLDQLLERIPNGVTVGYLEKAVMNDVLKWRMELENRTEQKRKKEYDETSE